MRTRRGTRSVPAEATDVEREWIRRLEEFDRSGLSRADYAEPRGLTPSTLSWWRCEIARRERARARAGGRGQSPALLPVSILAPAPVASTKLRVAPIEVVVRDQVVIRVTAGFDPATLREVVEALTSC